MTRRRSARRSAGQTCASCRSSPANSWRCRRFTGFAVAWLLIRVRLVNQVRGLLGEHGIVVAKDIGNLRRALARIASDDEDRTLNPLVRSLMRELRQELAELDARIADYDRKIRELYRNSEICQRLGKVEGIGPVTATALVAAVGDRSSFKNGRQFAAWLGLVPKQRSSGGRARLFGISKRGDRYLRTLLIHGARSALGRVRDKQDPRSLWLGRMRQRRHLPERASPTIAIEWRTMAKRVTSVASRTWRPDRHGF